MFVQILTTLVLSCLSGLFYRFGGMGKEEQSWVPMFLRRSWVRDWVIPAFSLGILFIWWQPEIWWGYFLSIPAYGLMGGATSTYWDKLTKLWRGDESEYWENWLLHGFFIGLSFFPFCFVGLSWLLLLISSIVSGALMSLLCTSTGNVWIEEFGRGFIAALTRIILIL